MAASLETAFIAALGLSASSSSSQPIQAVFRRPCSHSSSSSSRPSVPSTSVSSTRIHHPSLPSDPFLERGSLRLDDASTHASFIPVPELDTDLRSFAQTALQLDDALYQLALVSAADAVDAPSHVSSVKACHLPYSTSESIVLHIASKSGHPYAFDYFIAPVPHDAACPRPASSGASPAPVPSRNTSVMLSFPALPFPPALRAPPQLTPQGEPVKPVQEKSFIQKYWMYILLMLGVMMLVPGPDEPSGGQGRRQ
ncbi:hypothetical protein EVG20_g5448 [Dentipellis fragilis]|uniref:Uncharacterized protein n=1 Tax=Dentipellis fragilis TaxID=205917 RepID=A0A4Y9YTC6_9AGAM|nr:hypothetical protein EVG20_g5448 [Dentipellis fragilis]